MYFKAFKDAVPLPQAGAQLGYAQNALHLQPGEKPCWLRNHTKEPRPCMIKRENEKSTKLRFDEADVDAIAQVLTASIKSQCDVARQELAI